MELNKKKYTLDEVRKIISLVERECETKLNNQKERISILLEENKKLEKVASEYREKDALISATLLSAREKATEIEESARLKYSLVVEALKKFSTDWKEYFDFLKEKYPNYSTIQKAVTLKEELDEGVHRGDDEEIVASIGGKLTTATEKLTFSPKDRINDYIASTSDNGFNIEEVLNPGKLELEDLCKELGLME